MEAFAQVLDNLRRHCETILTYDADDRIALYRKIDACLLQLEGALRQKPDAQASALLAELKLHIIMGCRLYEPDEQTDEQHYAATLDLLEALRGRWSLVAGS